MNPNSTTAKPRATKPPKAPAELKISPRTLKRLKDIFKLLADVNRLKILLSLAEDGEMHVSALCDLLDQTQPAVSHHLTLLRMTGIVGYRRDGKHNFYRLESSLVRDLLDQFANESSVNGGKNGNVEDLYVTFKRK